MAKKQPWYNRDDDAPIFPADVMAEILGYVRAALAYVKQQKVARAWRRVDERRRQNAHERRLLYISKIERLRRKTKLPAGSLAAAIEERRVSRLEALKEAK